MGTAMALLQLFILCLGVQYSAAFVVLSPGEGKIVGGSPATIEEFPYLVSIRRSAYLGTTVYHYCGGSIISTNWVLSAGHCTSGLETRNLHVYAGSTNRREGGMLYNVTKIVAHPQYYISARGIPLNDIGVIKVATPFVFGPKVAAIKLPTESIDAEVVTGTIATVAGWGATQVNGVAVLTLLQVSVPIVSQRDCERIYNGSFTIAETMLCAGYQRGGKGACEGDSGGALAAAGTQVGIVSWGIQCDETPYPGAYTNVGSYRKWIASETDV